MDEINFPSEFYKGDSINCKDFYEEFLPSDDWTVSYYLINKDNVKIILKDEIVSDKTQNKYVITVNSLVSSSFSDGKYSLNAVFYNTVDFSRVTKFIKEVIINKDLTSVSNVDNRNWAEIALENIQKYLLNPNTASQRLYEYKGRKLEQYDLKELREHMEWLEYQVSKTRRTKGGSKVYLRFNNYK